MPDEQNRKWLEVACNVARAAGDCLHARTDRTVNLLSDKDVKLQADVDSEKLIRERLAATGLPVIGEEQGGDAALLNADTPYWVVDPLDGTFNYLRGQPATCVSIGLMRGKKPVLGAIFDFNLNELYAGAAGWGFTLNQRLVEPVWAAKLSQACLMTGFTHGGDYSSRSIQAFVTQVQSYKKIRMIGSAALALAYVAAGRADVYMEKAVNLWDLAAGAALIEAAGGHVILQANPKKPLSFDVWAAGRKEFLPAQV